jgi:micrococcal nuclease
MKVIDTMSWNFPLMDDYILTAENLNIESQKVKVIEVIDGDTLLIEFPDGEKEKLRLIGVDTPETKHPKKKVEYF